MTNLPKFLRLLISFVFILSALAKLFDLSATVQMFATLFALSPGFVASLFTWGVILFELVIACLIWWRVPWPLVLVPLVFIAIVVYADSQGLACGCFGSLSFLQLSLPAHVALNVGLFLGLLALHQSKSDRRAAAQPVALLAVVVIVTPLVFSSFSHLLSPSSGLDIPRLEYADVQAAIESNTDLLIDARADFQYAFGHIPGALNIPFDTENLSEQISQHSLQDRPLIVYCSSADCPAAEQLAARLVAAGCRFVRLYPGGWDDWLARGGDVAVSE